MVQTTWSVSVEAAWRTPHCSPVPLTGAASIESMRHLLLMLLLTGCGASSATIARYAAEQTLCLRNERAIIDRSGTSEEEDEADYAAEQARCDAALLIIEGAP